MVNKAKGHRFSGTVEPVFDDFLNKGLKMVLKGGWSLVMMGSCTMWKYEGKISDLTSGS